MNRARKYSKYQKYEKTRIRIENMNWKNECSAFDSVQLNKSKCGHCQNKRQWKNHEKKTPNANKIINIAMIIVAFFEILFRQKNVQLFAMSVKNIEIKFSKKAKSIIDSKTIVSVKYHDYLNVFFKKKNRRIITA